MEPPKRLIVALDLPDVTLAENLVSELGEFVSFYKIGLSLIPIGGFSLIKKLKKDGKKVFLDLKLFDIASTVENTVKNLSHLGIDFLTVHGDPYVIRAALKGKQDCNLKILAVTFLTNVDRVDLDSALIQSGKLDDLVVKRAQKAFTEGADGVIASANECLKIRSLKESYGKLIVTPGIRRVSSLENDDQKRVCTPEAAISNGSDFIVMGRPIHQSPKPREKVVEILREIERIKDNPKLSCGHTD
ncbi:MAG: orotidine-5'-phosphate decarboxylase [Pseudomonadota bacterium]|nr:orotidine-5'-phosphate decarboxylase [Pseudomonadota bacterium]